MKKIGETINNIRKDKRYSQKEMEIKTEIKREYLSKIENGELKNPTLKTLSVICQALGIKVWQLLKDADI